MAIRNKINKDGPSKVIVTYHKCNDCKYYTHGIELVSRCDYTDMPFDLGYCLLKADSTASPPHLTQYLSVNPRRKHRSSDESAFIGVFSSHVHTPKWCPFLDKKKKERIKNAIQ